MLNQKSMTFVDTITLFFVVAVAWLHSEYGELMKKFENETGDSHLTELKFFLVNYLGHLTKLVVDVPRRFIPKNNIILNTLGLRYFDFCNKTIVKIGIIIYLDANVNHSTWKRFTKQYDISK